MLPGLISLPTPICPLSNDPWRSVNSRSPVHRQRSTVYIFYGKLRNAHTRAAYERAVKRFLAWCQDKRLELRQISPAAVGRYLDEHPGAISSKKLALAALRHFFDGLVTRHVIILNPAHSVRAERYQVLEGKTPEITVKQARKLLGSIDLSTDWWDFATGRRSLF